MTKPFLTFDEQLDKLEKEKRLRISDREFAKDKLEKIGYFSLIGGYKDLFKDPTTRLYKRGVRFEDICALYDFDEALRELYLKYILRAERCLRSLISYYFCQRFGERQQAYLSRDSYTDEEWRSADVTKLIETLDQAVNGEVKDEYILYQRSAHGNVPLWVLINSLTIGNLSKLYICLPQDLRAKVSKHFPMLNQRQLGEFLRVITYFRNQCAHGKRLFSYKTKQAVPDTSLHKLLALPKKGEEYKYGKKDLFAVTIGLRYLLHQDEADSVLAGVRKLTDSFAEACGMLDRRTLMEEMGFPENWQNISKAK